jgi:hypothetical protein
MFGPVRSIASSLLVVLALGACAPAQETLAVVANAPTSLGTGAPQRVLVGLVDAATGESLAAPDLSVSAALSGPEGDPIEVPAEFLWTIDGVRGLYLIQFEFPRAGEWQVQLRPEGISPTPAAPFRVEESSGVIEVGEPVPAVATRTGADHPLAEISSDPDPDPSFYQLSIDQAVKSGRATVVVFATPRFCESQTCGPLLDQVKALSSGYPEVNFIHVEIYENLDAPSLDQLRIVEAVTSFGLPSEPWVFVVDREGLVAARFEGAASDQELSAAIEAAS